MHVPIEVARRARDRAAELGADGCVAVGGGSAIGLGKAIALEHELPVIAIPTTYAGSEMTPVWGLTEGGAEADRPRRAGAAAERALRRGAHPDAPAGMSVTSGLNAVAHAVEGLYAPDATPIISLMAEEGTRALAAALPRIVADGGDLEARAEAQYGAWLCGAVLAATTMSLHHKLCHTLGGTLDLPHAQTHTVVLPHALAYNQPAAPDAVAALSRALGGTSDPARELWELAGRLDAPRSLAELGMAGRGHPAHRRPRRRPIPTPTRGRSPATVSRRCSAQHGRAMRRPPCGARARARRPGCSGRFQVRSAVVLAVPGSGDATQGSGGHVMQVGFAGLGRMGRPMARHLAVAGHQVIAYDPAVPAGSVPVELRGRRDRGDRRRGPAGQTEVSVSMLPDAAATERLLLGESGLLASCAPSHVHVVMGTIGLRRSARARGKGPRGGRRTRRRARVRQREPGRGGHHHGHGRRGARRLRHGTARARRDDPGPVPHRGGRIRIGREARDEPRAGVLEPGRRGGPSRRDCRRARPRRVLRRPRVQCRGRTVRLLQARVVPEPGDRRRRLSDLTASEGRRTRTRPRPRASLDLPVATTVGRVLEEAREAGLADRDMAEVLRLLRDHHSQEEQ